MTLKIRCPRCGHAETLSVPTDRCVLVHTCAGCGAELRREPGACCVFCSHPDDPANGTSEPARA